MSRNGLSQAFDQVIQEAAEKDSVLRFRRQGSTHRVIEQDCAGLIEFQKSTTNSADQIRFTINLAVVCRALLNPDQSSLEKARSPEAHLRLRIGMLLPGRPDKWWEIKDGVNVAELAGEVSTLIATEAAPYVTRYLDRGELISLWRSGESPGLTETQRLRYLEQLSRGL